MQPELLDHAGGLITPCLPLQMPCSSKHGLIEDRCGKYAYILMETMLKKAVNFEEKCTEMHP